MGFNFKLQRWFSDDIFSSGVSSSLMFGRYVLNSPTTTVSYMILFRVSTGCPPTFSLAYVDCSFPQYDTNSSGKDSVISCCIQSIFEGWRLQGGQDKRLETRRVWNRTDNSASLPLSCHHTPSPSLPQGSSTTRRLEPQVVYETLMLLICRRNRILYVIASCDILLYIYFIV